MFPMMQQAHEGGVRYVVHFAQENGYYPYGTQRLLLYRETSPQAFPGPTGDYHAFKVRPYRYLQPYLAPV